MAEVLCIYREVEVLKKAPAKSKRRREPAVAIISCDEKPGIQAIATTAPDLPPEPGVHATFARDHQYKRHGTLSLLAGIDLLTGKVQAPSSGIGIAARSSSNFSSFSMPLTNRHCDQTDRRQPFGAHLQTNQSLARCSARRPLQVHLYA